MKEHKELAFELRRQGKSYKQIRDTLGIPLGTLGSWFSKEAWSTAIRDQLADNVSLKYRHNLESVSKANKQRWDALRQSYRAQAKEVFPALKEHPLFIAGIMLYWGEGDKTNQPRVRLANSDPDMIKLFRLFLIQALNIPPEKIRLWLLLYPDLVESVQKRFWSTLIGVPMEQFRKSMVITGKHPTRRLSYGVCYIEIYSREYKEKMLAWIELYKHEFLKP